MSRAMYLVAGLVASVVFPSAVASAADLVERPMVLEGATQNVIHLNLVDLTDSTWDGTDVGVSTHGGLFTSTDTGSMDLTTGHWEGDGVMVVADGDKLNVHMEGWFDGQVTRCVMYLDGGTGRFEQATGMLTGSYEPTIMVVSETMWVSTANFVVTGTIKY